MAPDIAVAEQRDERETLIGSSPLTTSAPIGGPPAIETRALHKRFGRKVVVHDLTFTVQQGEVFGFLGPNGAGKTTSIKMLMGLVRPTSGEARLLGLPAGRREARRRIGFLPELFRFHDWLSGREVLDLHGRLYGMSTAHRSEAIPRALDLVGLSRRGDDPLRTYSKGMQQRIGIAQAILNDPLVVFLDEPTSALDPVGRLDVRNLIRHLRDEGRTVLLNSHLLSEVEMVCDRVAIIHHGRVATIGPLDDLRQGDVLVQLLVTTLPPEHRAILEAHGRVHDVLDWRTDRVQVTLELPSPELVPDLVAALAAAGAQIHSVTPHTTTLEELFFNIVRDHPEDEVRA